MDRLRSGLATADTEDAALKLALAQVQPIRPEDDASAVRLVIEGREQVEIELVLRD